MRGVERIWREVSRGFGFGECGETWWRESVEDGPEERSSGCTGWKASAVMADYTVILAIVIKRWLELTG